MKECPLCRTCADDAVEACPLDGSRLDTTIDGPVLLHGKYALERRLGQGGMGIVYRARHLDLHRSVAIKIITTTGDEFLDRFRIEAAALGRLKHPHIVDVMDFGADADRGLAYLVMELLEGVTLAARCEASGPLGRREAVELLRTVGTAVDFAHANGILHGDLKPSNVFLVRSQAGPSIKILDFGLAQFVGSDHLERDIPISFRPDALANADATTALVQLDAPSRPDSRQGLLELQRHDRRVVMGTHGYMAPELFRLQPATRATDLYAFGVLAYQLLTGIMPPIRHTADTMPPPSAVGAGTPPELDAPVMKLLEFSPENRPVSASAAAAAIASAERAAGFREWQSRERPRRIAAAVALSALTGLGAAVWMGPPIERLERFTVDARFALARPRPPDPTLLLVFLDDASVDADPRPLSLRADDFGAALNRIFEAGARAIGVDLLLPATWSTSAPFARMLVQHADRVTLGAFTTETGTVLGPECMPGLVTELLGPDRVRSLFGFVNLEADADGIARYAPMAYRDTDGGLRSTWAASVAHATRDQLPAENDRGRIDYTLDPDQFRRMSWKDIDASLTSSPETFRNRIVLVGADFAGSGDANHRVLGQRHASAMLPGIIVQALAVNTILDGFPVREVWRWPAVAGASVAAGLTVFLALMRRRSSAAFVVVGGLIVLYVIFAFAMFAVRRTIWPIAGPSLSALTAFAAALALRAAWGTSPSRG